MFKELTKGIAKENPILVQVLGMCPTLAVTTAAINGVAMGLAVIFVLTMSNLVISLIRGFIPDKVRIPSFIVVIASFVTIVDLVMHGYFIELHHVLGIFIPLIVVNCIILGRAEAFASKNGVFASILDGIGMGIGFTLVLVLLGSVREILGNGTIFGYHLFPASFKPVLVMIMPPGAFIALGFIVGIFNKVRS
ncbi:MAG: electron transport complex subunit E [Acidobacteria bacterium]|nr:electron transport complex subunit E [Acidobacteriota bacterium]